MTFTGGWRPLGKFVATTALLVAGCKDYTCSDRADCPLSADAGQSVINNARGDTGETASTEFFTTSDPTSGTASDGQLAEGDSSSGAPTEAERPANCGDGIVDGDELCDRGDANNDDVSGECNTRCQANLCSKGDTRPCRGAQGNCALGVETCEAGQWGACSIQPQGADSCDEGDDANCNGITREGCACVEGTTRSCAQGGALGECANGTQVCDSEGKYGPCSISPKESDDCSKPLDDSDCDGVPNDGCPCVSGPEGDPPRSCGPATSIGECKTGTISCVDGEWSSTCEGAVTAQPRDCRVNQDLDCDGLPDNTLDNVCQCTVGEMRECEAHPGLDGIGPCRAGSQVCETSADGAVSTWSACKGDVGPATADSCSRVDDANCNGINNDGCECLEGEEKTCGEVFGSTGDCASKRLVCTRLGKWPASSQCSPTSGENCGQVKTCTPGVFDGEGVVFDDACFQ